MAIAALVLSVIAIVVSVASAVYTRIGAVETRGLRQIEHDRRLEERRPKLTGVVGRTGEKSGVPRITLMSDAGLAGMDITIPYKRGGTAQGVWFKPGSDGAEARPSGERSYWGFGHVAGKRTALPPRESMTWEVNLADKHVNELQIEATCVGKDGEVWRDVLIEAPVQPDVSRTVW